MVGLGNPGRGYAATRHNVGFLFIRRLARRYKMKLRKKKYQAKIAEGRRDGDELVLAQPQTYMNKSGVAVKRIMEGYGVPPENVIIVYDDLDIPLGQIRVRPEGSAGTHQGMRSVIGETGRRSFPRIRVGIGHVAGRGEAPEFVLSPFAKEELPPLEKALARAEEAAELILAGRIQAAMNAFNRSGMI
ncbi:MAG: aminoacyl-tRNA hydrolase [Acidobacteriota bacterium]